MLFKLVVFGFVAILAYMFFTGKFSKLTKARKQKIDATNMIECETCGSYVAEKDAVHANGISYCSKSCRDA